MAPQQIRTAILSVYDKTGIVELASELRKLGVELLSTGGTAKLLLGNGISVRQISDYTGFPEILDGRVKTLHPKIHAGLLFRREYTEDEATVRKLEIQPIDMVVVNLYPFVKATAESNDLNNALENIDIGGPTMIRAAAKNYRNVAVVTDPADYPKILSEIKSSGQLSEGIRLELMLKAFERTAAYDVAISTFFTRFALKQGVRSDWPGPGRLLMSFEKLKDLRYGENPHQKATVYRDTRSQFCIASANQVAGEKELSYTNILDADAAYRLIMEFRDEVATMIIKHTNPCGVARGGSLVESCQKALATDPLSAFGGVYAFTRIVDSDTANLLADKFVELILAPGYQPEALKSLSSKKNRRILDVTSALALDRQGEKNHRGIFGGILYQDSDQLLLDKKNLKVVTKRAPSAEEEQALMFAWKLVKHVKSNAIVLCSKDQLVGVGAGQMSRVDSCKIALMKAKEAGLQVKGTVMASDAFLPFRDSVDLMSKEGVTAIIQPGGSIRDSEVIQAADEFGMTMLFTGIRHFRH